jgi:WD40 repeat protein
MALIFDFFFLYSDKSSGMKILHLKGHQADVHSFAWSPVRRQLATASTDGVSRIWNMNDVDNDDWNSLVPTNTVPSSSAATASSTERNIPVTTCLLPHKNVDSQRFCEVNSVAWNSEGTLLATSCNDGIGRIWDYRGNLITQLIGHQEKAPMIALKWSRNGELLVSRGSDCQIIVWNASDGRKVKTFVPHEESSPEVDWKDSDIFATCGGKDL